MLAVDLPSNQRTASPAALQDKHWHTEQSGHLDGIIKGLFLLLNMMASHAWVGLYLNSGRYVSALKELAISDFFRFKTEFDTYPAVDASGQAAPGGKTLRDEMEGSNNQSKLRAAWRAYVAVKLKKEDQLPWKRVYARVPEASFFFSSMCSFHFGARFPLIFSQKAVPDNLLHLRIHMYFGSKLFRCPSEDLSAGIDANPAQDSTVDIFSTDEANDWLSPAQQWAEAAMVLRPD